MKSLFGHFAVIFVAFLGYSTMIAIFTPMMMVPFKGIVPPDLSLSLRVILLGILLSLYPLGQCIGSPCLLSWCKKFGTKDIYLLSLAVTTLGYAFIATSLDGKSLGLLYFSVFFTGLSESNISMALHAIAEQSDPCQRPKWIGWIHVSSSGAFLFGPLLAGLLIHREYGNWAWISAPFWCIFGLLAVCFIWKSFSRSLSTAPLLAPLPMRKVIGMRRVRPIFFINMLLYFAIFGFFRAYPMDLVHRFHEKVLRLGLLMAYVAVPIVLINGFWIKAIARTSSMRKTAAWGAFVAGALMIALACLPSSTVLLLIVLGGISCGIGLCLASTPLLVSKFSRFHHEAEALEGDETILLGMEAISSFVGGLLAAVFIQLPLVVFGFLAMLAAFFLIKSKAKRALIRKN